MNCFFCEGPAHPATGHAFNERVIACYACTVEFWHWFRARQHGREPNFCDAAMRWKTQ